MRILKLIAVSAAYVLILVDLYAFQHAEISLGASLFPIVLVFRGKQIYVYLKDSKKFIDFDAGMVFCFVFGIPFLLLAGVINIVRHADPARSIRDADCIAITIILEWLVYVLYWSGEATVAFYRSSRKRSAIRKAAMGEATREKEAAARKAYELAEKEQQSAAAQAKQQQDDRIRLESEHEKDFYRLRDETIGLFLKHHELLKDEIAVVSIMKEYEEQQPSVRDSWSDFVRFNKRWQFRILVGAANNLLNDYCQAEESIGEVFPRDQFMLLVKDAMRRDAGTYDLEACIARLTSLHDKIVQLFNDRSPQWQSQRDAVRADAYDEAFAETEHEPEGQNPFDDDNRLTYQQDAG